MVVEIISGANSFMPVTGVGAENMRPPSTAVPALGEAATRPNQSGPTLPSVFTPFHCIQIAAVMSVLCVGKTRIAARMQSRSLRAEATETLFCDLQDFTILIGLGLNALFSWWWADPVSVLVLVPFLVKEGRENLSDDEEEHERQVCFCTGRFYGLCACRAACCRA